MDLEVREDKKDKILTPKEVSEILKISMDKTYELIQSPGFPKLNYHRLKAGGFFRAKAQTLRLKVAFGAKAPSFPD